MEEELISYQTAILAKEKGFNIPCGQFYGKHVGNRETQLLKKISEEISLIQCKEHGIYAIIIEDYNNQFDEIGNPIITNECSAPTQALLQRWLMDKKGVKVYCIPSTLSSAGNDWTYVVIAADNGKITLFEQKDTIFDSYDVSLEKGLLIGLKLIK